MYKKIINIIAIFFLVTSCESMNTAKKALTGEKRFSTDEFLIQKKDPLILPPDYDSLPTPDERITAINEISTFEKTLGVSTEDSSSASGSLEDSILKKIQSK